MEDLPGLARDTGGATEPSMRRPSKFRQEEVRLARYSRRLADSESRLVTPTRLAEAVNEFIKWRAFSYWLRLIVEAEGVLSERTTAILKQRCPGFVEYATAFSERHPREPQFLWLRFLEWADNTVFEAATAQGWRHALGYHATRDPRMDQLRAYWKQCHQAWAAAPPAVLPCFDDWRQAAVPGL
jgi:hypothetical protein